MVNELKMVDSYPIALETFGLVALSDLFDDRVVYRNLEPLDRKLPGLKSARYQLGLNDQSIPRKLDDAYAKVALWILDQAQDRRRASLEELLVIGDTLSGDGRAFENICTLGDLPGSAFIGNEEAEQPAEHMIDESGHLYIANRWSSIVDWLDWSLSQGLALDKNTVVVVDIDKTALGARGRNDRAVDSARLQGLYRTVGDVLGNSFDAELFKKDYDALNRMEYHSVTEDNQDYLAYICLVLNTGLIDRNDLMQKMKNGSLNTFRQFVRWVETRMAQSNPSESMRQVQLTVMTSVRQGDPTPFKQFRRKEYEATLEHMNNLPDDVPMEKRLTQEILITQEVYESVLWLRERGCLIIGLSDKPDEASVPHRTFHRGKEPVHRAQTHAVGVTIQEQLDALG